ncbi:MAG: DUF2026 family protein [Lysobacter sp.]|nr:DUF2026 family protein [Lysobacter sp.]
MDHTPLIRIKDYERIHDIAHAVLKGQQSIPHKSCLFFSMAGAYILSTRLKIEARPVAGAAFYCVSKSTDKSDILSFAKVKKDDGTMAVDSDEDSFHCWVESEDWIIDFTAPLFNFSAQEAGFESPVPRRMFQKKKVEMNDSPNLERAGDFFLLPNQHLTNELLEKNLIRNDVRDLLDICSQWFMPADRKMRQELKIGSSDGKITQMRIVPASLNSKW